MRTLLSASLIALLMATMTSFAANRSKGAIQLSCRKALDSSGQNWAEASNVKQLVEILKKSVSLEQCRVFARPWLAPNN